MNPYLFDEPTNPNRHDYVATFKGRNKTAGYNGHIRRLIAFENVTDIATGEIIADKLWTNEAQAFDNVAPVPGDVLAFSAELQVLDEPQERKLEDGSTARDSVKLLRPTKVVNRTHPDAKPAHHGSPSATTAQRNYIAAIASELNIAPPDAETLTVTTASQWINQHVDAFKASRGK